MKKSGLVLPLIVAIFSLRWVFGYYFWHDDFAVFYGARRGINILGWPYGNYGIIFNSLYELLGYRASWYFVLGVGLFVGYLVAFWSWVKRTVGEEASVWATLMLATGYVGAGVFLEAYDPIITFPPLICLFLSLRLFDRFAQGKKIRFDSLALGCFLFGLGVVWFQARTSTFFAPPIVWVSLFARGRRLKKTMLALVCVLVVFWLSFVVLPLGLRVPQTGGYLFDMAVDEKFLHFMQTIGALFFTDEMKNLLFVGMSAVVYEKWLVVVFIIITSLYLIMVWRQRRNVWLIKFQVFSAIWIGVMFLPYLLRTDWRVEATHRYLIFMYPGLVFIWVSLMGKRAWKLITVGVIVANLIFANQFLGDHYRMVRKQAGFYERLHDQLLELEVGGTYYFGFPQGKALAFGDYFRVGTFPSEAALATEYGEDYREITLVTDDQTLRNLIRSGVEIDKFYSFYDDGEKTVETTDFTRNAMYGRVNAIEGEVSGKIVTEFIKGKDEWTGKVDEIKFEVNSFSPVIPFWLTFEAVSTVPDLPVPYTQGCVGCHDGSSGKIDWNEGLNFLSQSRNIKSLMRVSVDGSGEGTSADEMIDKKLSTAWVSKRQDWFKNIKPKIEIFFSEKVDVDGLVIVSSSIPHIPDSVRILINGREVMLTQEKIVDGVVYRWQTEKVGEMSMEILTTLGEDHPIINEILPIPEGMETVSLDELEKIKQSPAAYVKTIEDKVRLVNYLRQNSVACVKWEAPGFGSGSEEIMMVSDGRRRTYALELPSMGVGNFWITIGCINYPLSMEVSGYRLQYSLPKN